MIAKKLLLVSGLAVAAASANATVNLYTSGAFTLGGVFAYQNPLQPTYTSGSSESSISLVAKKSGPGSANQWWFAAVDSTSLTSVTYQLTVSGINATTDVSYEITMMSYAPSKNNPAVGTVGRSPIYIADLVPTNIKSITGSGAHTQTLDFTINLGTGTSTALNMYAGMAANKIPDDAFFKANFQFTNAVPEPTGVAALSIGAMGLLIRRRRSK